MVVFLVPQQFFLLFPPFLCPAASSLVAPPLERARRRWRSGSGSSPSRGPGRGPVRGPGPGRSCGRDLGQGRDRCRGRGWS